MRQLWLLVSFAAAFNLTTVHAQPKKGANPGQKREAKVRADREHVESDGYWIYNDLARGLEQAKTSGKPLLVTIRCIPCEACAQLDEQIVERDQTVRNLMDKFVCVRIVHANGLDLSLFQYDFDQSWVAFFLNADRTIYGRYGTRSHRTESEDDVSLNGFSKALQAALELHSGYPANKALLTGKQSPPAEVKVPEEFPSLSGKYTSKLDYGGKVVQSCIHCHQVGEAQRRFYHTTGKSLPEKLLHPYPNPRILGLILDPQEKARVKTVTPGSSAEHDGFRTGDEITTLAGQSILSIADVQWVLHHAGDAKSLSATVLRGGQPTAVTISLAQGWRDLDDISWRATSWDLRRMLTGGLVLEPATAAERKQAGIGDKELALRVKHVGQYGPHAVAKKAGFLKGDLVTRIRDRNDAMSESEVLTLLVRETKPGDKFNVTVLRVGKTLNLTLVTQ